MTAPLQGIKVVDLSIGGVGPFATMVLADLGADVLCIEAPAGKRGRPADPRSAARSAAVAVVFRNKRRITLDLQQAEAQQVLHQLVKDADVFTESFRPGVTARLKADYATLQKINPRLVYCSMTGFGQDGPYRDIPGHDFIFSAASGSLETGPMVDGYTSTTNVVGPFSGKSMTTVVGIMAALMARSRTGKGQYVDSAIADSGMYLMALAFSEALSGSDALQEGRALTSGTDSPFRTVYETKDGKYIALAAREDRNIDGLLQALGDTEFVGRHRDRSLFPKIQQFLEGIFKTRPRDEWFNLLKEKGVPAAPLNTLQEAVDDPHLRARGMVLDLGKFESEPIVQVAPPFKLSDSSTPAHRYGVPRGHNTDEVLASLGYSAEKIAALRNQSAID